ncbi:MAG: sigma-54-dependent Fis family transcriptional regulator [Gammaproteobacteria bacterium]|nr:sigma-54-dependent Fis family transcriptional regulator [Gammaproteobacteria bacterium]MBL6998408.1 sigma-54-dependent Fis family transcriptional regulator [Gammaproteobacteria bacterium]
MKNILIVDDEFSIRKTLGLLLKAEGFQVFEAGTIADALKYFDAQLIDLLITDLRLGEGTGIDLLQSLQSNGQATESIIMTAYGSIESAVDAMRLGAYDYLTKPINPDELLLRVHKVLERKALKEEVARLHKVLDEREQLKSIVAVSPAMLRILEIVEHIRQRSLPVLITGETGAGKEVIAQAIHASSDRAGKPFVAINCCTLPEDLLDSELFGHLKGSYTGATDNREGLFQQADGGTLFLDEIGDISARLQAKLLRVLQEGEVRPVGSDATVKVDVRIITATNRDLEQMVARNEFRSDLLFRMNVLPIHLPSLRERREDILPLVWHFIHLQRQQLGRDDLGLSAAAEDKLLRYDWPGNVRQVRNIIERSFALFSGPVLDAHEIMIASPRLPAAEIIEETALALEVVEARHIRAVLAAHENNQVTAARILGISRSTLRRKLSQMK